MGKTRGFIRSRSSLFSELANDLTGTTNALGALREKLRQSGQAVTDLVSGNVNEHGIVYPQDTLEEVLADALPAARIYRPDSFGQLVAREAIARLYSEGDELSISTEQIVLTPGTSVSYWYCFKLLADAGDEILCPKPTYPLFDYIAQLSGLTLTYYRLLEDREWAIDLDHLAKQIGAKTRAIVVISPHNPTGMVCSFDQLGPLADLAVKHELPIISDEVFSKFLFDSDLLPRVANTKAPLVFTLNGLSKMLALPQLKLGWMVVTGDATLVERAMETLEMIADTFLPVNEVIQFALPKLLEKGESFLGHYIQTVRERRDIAVEALAGKFFVAPRGGFYLTLPIVSDEEETALDLLAQHHLLVHPGYFYDMEGNHLVMSFVQEPHRLRPSLDKIRTKAASSQTVAGQDPH